MTEAVLDLSALDGVDLEALRLGAQVMTYKAGLADQPRVEAFFASLRIGVDGELASRDRSGRRGALVAVALADPEPLPGATREDALLVQEYLDLLSGNPRLSPAVRDACDAIRAQLSGATRDHRGTAPGRSARPSARFAAACM